METYIVTLKISQHELDMELSASAPMEQLMPKIAEALDAIDAPLRLTGAEKVVFLGKGCVLAPSDTLESVGAFDGSVLQIIS